MEKFNEKEFSMNLEKYKEEQKQFKAKAKELEDLYKLSKQMNVKNIDADTVSINAAQEKIDKNTAWLKRVGSDIYIDETVKVMNTMINQSATAKRN